MLVWRILYDLGVRDTKSEQILVTTFTRRAATELNVRIVERSDELLLVFPLTILAMNSGHVWRTTDASFDWSRSTQKGAHSDGCIQARKPTHES